MRNEHARFSLMNNAKREEPLEMLLEKHLLQIKKAQGEWRQLTPKLKISRTLTWPLRTRRRSQEIEDYIREAGQHLIAERDSPPSSLEVPSRWNSRRSREGIYPPRDSVWQRLDSRQSRDSRDPYHSAYPRNRESSGHHEGVFRKRRHDEEASSSKWRSTTYRSKEETQRKEPFKLSEIQEIHAPLQKENSDSQRTISDQPQAARLIRRNDSPPLVRSRPYRLNLHRGVISKAKEVATDAASSETHTSAKRSLVFGDKAKDLSPVQKMKELVPAISKEKTFVKSWYEQTLEEDEEDQMFNETNQHALLKALDVGTETSKRGKEDIPLNEEIENRESLNHQVPMEEDENFENDETDFQIDAVLEDDWYEDDEQVVAEGDDEDLDFENDDLLDESFEPDSDIVPTPMEEDRLESEPPLSTQDPTSNAGLVIIPDLSSGGLPPRGPHLRFSPAQRKKLLIAGVSSRKMNALSPRISPRKSPKTRPANGPANGPAIGQSVGPNLFPRSPTSASSPSDLVPPAGPAGPPGHGPEKNNFPLNEELPLVPKKTSHLFTGSASASRPVKKKE